MNSRIGAQVQEPICNTASSGANSAKLVSRRTPVMVTGKETGKLGPYPVSVLKGLQPLNDSLHPVHTAFLDSVAGIERLEVHILNMALDVRVPGISSYMHNLCSGHHCPNDCAKSKTSSRRIRQLEIEDSEVIKGYCGPFLHQGSAWLRRRSSLHRFANPGMYPRSPCEAFSSCPECPQRLVHRPYRLN